MGNTCCSQTSEPSTLSTIPASIYSESHKGTMIPSPKFTTLDNLSINSTPNNLTPSQTAQNSSNLQKITAALTRVDSILLALGPTYTNEYHKLTQPHLPTLGPLLTPHTNTIYHGQYHNRKREGLGTLIDPDNFIYHGEFSQDLQNGKGILIDILGRIYIGDRHNNQANGIGKFIDKDFIYDGKWKDDTREGMGVETYPDGSKFQGNFLGGVKSGYGVFDWADGSFYAGDFENGEIHGKGVYQWGDGRRYEGSWVHN
jgi:hypothetical protein